MSTPIIGRNCVFMDGAAAVAHGKNITVDWKRDQIESRVFESANPDSLDYGNIHTTFKVEFVYFQNEGFLAKVLAGTKLTIKVRPQGTGAGKEEWTLTDCVIDLGVEIPQNEHVRMNVTGKATSFTQGTQ